MNTEITREQWEAWLTDHCTVALRRIAQKRRQEIRLAWENGAFVTKPHEDSMSIGGCKALMLLEDMDYDEVIVAELGDEDVSK